MAILVVDDSRAMRMIVKRELRHAGYEDVEEADNGTRALEIIRGGGIDLVLSDWNMPDMNGIDLLDRLRATGNDLPFGFITSESAPDVRARALGSGAKFIVTKPFTSADLDREITLALGGSVGLGEARATGDRTVDQVLEGLIGRTVTVSDAPPPDRSGPRGLARYRSASGQTVFAVLDMSLAAGLACALARIPGREAEEWARAHAFNETVEANFFEVANVLGGFASPSAERCVLQSVEPLTEGELPAAIRGAEDWHRSVHVDVDSYPSGRLGFVVAA